MNTAESLEVQAWQPRSATLVRMLVEPVVVLALLVVAAAWFERGIEAPYVILALLVFAMTFPGRVDSSTVGFGRFVGRMLASWAGLVALLVLLGWATGTLAAFDPRVVVVWAAGTPVVLLAAHWVVLKLLSRLLAAERVRKTAVIIGANRMGRMLAERIESSKFLGMRFGGYFDDRNDRRVGDIAPSEKLGTLRDLPAYVKANDVDVIYFTLPMCSQPRVLELLRELHDTTASIHFVPDILVFDLIQARVDSVGGIPTVALCESPYFGVNAWLKRASDVLIAGLVLVLMAPLLGAIALAVKLSSPGPVLFKQRRYGADGRQIVIYKFRTMTCLQDGDVVKQARRDDPRLTRFGAFLRRCSLDELPQFINVLQGRMSVVGPRPHAVAHNEMYRKLIRGYMMRHKVRPGITGLAQINGHRGETETVEKMRARVGHDLAYLRNWSLGLDLKIVLKTFGAVWSEENAY